MARNIFLQHKVKDLEDLTPIFTKAINKVDNRWALALGEKQNFNGQAGRSSFLMKKQDLSVFNLVFMIRSQQTERDPLSNSFDREFLLFCHFRHQ